MLIYIPDLERFRFLQHHKAILQESLGEWGIIIMFQSAKWAAFCKKIIPHPFSSLLITNPAIFILSIIMTENMARTIMIK